MEQELQELAERVLANLNERNRRTTIAFTPTEINDPYRARAIPLPHVEVELTPRQKTAMGLLTLLFAPDDPAVETWRRAHLHGEAVAVNDALYNVAKIEDIE